MIGTLPGTALGKQIMDSPYIRRIIDVPLTADTSLLFNHLVYNTSLTLLIDEAK